MVRDKARVLHAGAWRAGRFPPSLNRCAACLSASSARCALSGLAEPVDVYASWIDACEATAKEGADGSGAAGMLDDL